MRLNGKMGISKNKWKTQAKVYSSVGACNTMKPVESQGEGVLFECFCIVYVGTHELEKASCVAEVIFELR
jgi:hypothetical protein